MGLAVVVSDSGRTGVIPATAAGAPEVSDEVSDDASAFGHGAFKDGPPARTTGGFGEESCIGCHFGADENDGHGRIFLEGLPERYLPNERYSVVVHLTRHGMAAGGFQLAARRDDGLTQAGSFEVPADEETRVGILRERGVEFAHHTWDGVDTVAPDSAAWHLVWVAPEEAVGTVFFHGAGVAADDDDSQIGDHVYTTEVALEGPAAAQPTPPAP